MERFLIFAPLLTLKISMTSVWYAVIIGVIRLFSMVCLLMKIMTSFLRDTGYIKLAPVLKVSKGAKIRNRYNQVPHLTQDTNVTNAQLDTTNESQEVSSFPAGDHKAHINRRAQRHSKHKSVRTKT